MTPPLDLSRFDGHTPGPWDVFDYDGQYVAVARRSGAYVAQCSGISATIEGEQLRSNAELCAAAPTLLAEVRALRAERERLREALDRIAGGILDKAQCISIARAALANA